MVITIHHCLACDDGAGVGSDAAGNHVKEGGFADAVLSYNAYSLTFFKDIVEVIKHHLVVKTFRDGFHLKNLTAEALHVEAELYLLIIANHLGFFFQVEESVNTCAGFSCTSLWCCANPFKLTFDHLPGFFGGYTFVLLTFAAFTHVIIEVTLMSIYHAMIHLKNLITHSIKEISVVSDHEECHVRL